MKVLKIAVIAAALVAGFYAPSLIKHFSQPTELASLDGYCLLSTQACVQDDVSMTLSVDAAQPLIPAQIEVNWKNNGADQLVLSLVGREMDMGKPTFIIKKVSSGKFVGDITLPVCAHGSMTWLGELSDGTKILNPAIKMQR